MSQAERLPPHTVPAPLYRRIGFDPALEQRALRCLADLDLAGCEAAYAELASRLHLPPGPAGRAGVVLLLDVLQRAEQFLHPDQGNASAYHTRRAALCEQFASYEDPEEARRAFGAAIGALLDPLRHATGSARGLVARARAYIEGHYQERLSLSKVAAHLHVSANYLSRVFRRVTGETLTRYVHRVRLERALPLLASGERTISEVAYLVGYQNYRDFYRNFVKQKQKSPRQLRRQLTRQARPQPAG